MLPVASLLPAPLRVHSVETPPGHPPAAPRLPLAFEPFLYLTPAHQALQAHGHPVLAFFLEDEAAGRTVAQLYVVLDYQDVGQARSPGQASFGGVQLAPGLPGAALHPLLATAEATLRARGQRGLEVRGYAFCYDPTGAAALAEALRQRGYRVVLAEQNYHLDTSRDFEAHLSYNERHCLRKCRRAGFVLEQEPPLLLPLAYEFLAACRRERGQPLSLPLARVQELFSLFPRQHLLLSVREPSGQWAGVGIAIVASQRVLYDFYPATPLRLNKLSPAVLLHAGLHDFARATGLAVVDLGISTLNGAEPHVSLLNFKRHLGGIAGLKLTWHKAL